MISTNRQILQMRRLLLNSSRRHRINYNTSTVATTLSNHVHNNQSYNTCIPLFNNHTTSSKHAFSTARASSDNDTDADINGSEYKALKSQYEDELVDDHSSDPLYALKREVLKEQRALAKKGQEVLATRKGRLFDDDWEVTDDDIMAGAAKFMDTPDWDDSVVSTRALEKVFVLESIPTIHELAELEYEFLPSAPPHPSYDKAAYVASYKEREHTRIYSVVSSIAKHRIPKILEMSEEEQQNAIDELFVYVEGKAMESEGIRLGNKRMFAQSVERALEEYLDFMNEQEKVKWEKDAQKLEQKEDSEEKAVLPSKEGGAVATDGESAPSSNTLKVPPNKGLFVDIQPYPNYFLQSGYAGHIQEDFDLSAHDETLRLLLRNITQQIAQTLQKNKSHVYLDGRGGVGKSVCMNALVASVRHSDEEYICLFFTNGDKITQHFGYLIPSVMREGYYDLPSLAKDSCEQLLSIHGSQLETLELHSDEEKDLLKKYFTTEQLEELNYLNQEKISLEQIANTGSTNLDHSSQCYSFLVNYLTHHQTKYKFLIAVDEYNMYHWHSHYFHETWDEEVKRSIPFDKMTLLEPFLAPLRDDVKQENLMILASISHSRPVSMERSQALTANMMEKENVQVMEVPRYGKLENEAMIAHYECVGLGKLRFDKGKVLGDKHEVSFLHTVSGGVGRLLMNGVII